MVSNIPTPDDFYNTGNELLAFSWDIVAKLLIKLDDAGCYGFDTTEIESAYWNLSQRQLTTALSIMQQGIEFFIKGKICEVSPFLLITDPILKGRNQCDSTPIEFSLFRTVDAQDLIKIHNTFSEKSFTEQFTTLFKKLRVKRNTIMHSIGVPLSIQFGDIIENILYMHKELLPNKPWVTVRLESLCSSPDTELHGHEYITNEICHELSIIIKLLSKSNVTSYFNIDKSKRGYFCPGCYSEASHDSDFNYKLARLTSSDQTCDDLYCPVCDKNYKVLRSKCSKATVPVCPGNVISVEYDGMCTTCGQIKD